MLFLLFGCLRSQQPASVFQGWICSDSCTCCHTGMEIAAQTWYLTQWQCTYTRPASPSIDPLLPGAWQGSHWSTNFQVRGMTGHGKKPHGESRVQTYVCHSQGRCLNCWAMRQLASQRKTVVWSYVQVLWWNLQWTVCTWWSGAK